MGLTFVQEWTAVVPAVAFQLVLLASAGAVLWRGAQAGALAVAGRAAARQAGIVLLVLLLAAVVLFVDPYAASSFQVSDSVEYAVAAHRLYTNHSLSLPVADAALPARFLPWFSWFFVYPAYQMFGAELGNAVLAVAAYALLGVLAAYMIGSFLAGAWGGAAAALFMLLLPDYRYFSSEVLTDVPTTCLVLLSLLLYLVVAQRPGTLLDYLLAGLLAAAAAALRPLSAAVLLPFVLLSWRRIESHHMRKGLVLLLPTGTVILAGLWYNNSVFGLPLRSGYHFWLAVPYDYPQLLFSGEYFLRNLNTLLVHGGGLPLLLVVCAYLVLARAAAQDCRQQVLAAAAVRSAVRFFVIYAVPLVSFHLFYFYSSSRFYLPVQALILIFGAALAGGWLQQQRLSRRLGWVAAVLIVFAVLSWRVQHVPDQRQRQVAEQIAAHTPAQAVIVSGMNPVYLQTIVSPRRVMPVTRQVEFASKVITPVRVSRPEPPPVNWSDHRCAGLLRAGAREAYQAVALEDLGVLAAALKDGEPVFVESAFVLPAELAQLEKSYVFHRISPDLLQVVGVRPHS